MRRTHDRGKVSGCFVACLALIGLGVFGLFQWMPEPPRNTAAQARGGKAVKPSSGEVGSLGGLHDGVWLALSESAWDEMLDAQNIESAQQSAAELYRLATAGKVKFYPIGTPVRVLKSGFTSELVEVIEGADRGDRGWVQSEFVIR